MVKMMMAFHVKFSVSRASTSPHNFPSSSRRFQTKNILNLVAEAVLRRPKRGELHEALIIIMTFRTSMPTKGNSWLSRVATPH